MNTQPKNSGPAFPCASTNYRQIGMTLRDYFAGQALQGGITSASGLGQIDAKRRSEMLSEFSDLIFEIADAMIAARERKEGDQ